MWDVMKWPVAACVLLPWLLVYLGLHVVRRGIIFIDIAMAQMASLGICLALLFEFEPDSFAAYAIALGVTLVGAAIFAFAGKRVTRVPQEAIIGISYVIAAAAAILLLNRSAHGNEEIRNMLVGDITVVSQTEVWKCFAVFVVIRAIHFVLRKTFLRISFQRDEAMKQGLRVAWWDFLFYATFGVVVTVFVRVAGVLLVFSYLIAPAVLRGQPRPISDRSPAGRLDHFIDRWYCGPLLLLQVRPAVRCGNRLHSRRPAHSDLTGFVAPAAPCRRAGTVVEVFSKT